MIKIDNLSIKYEDKVIYDKFSCEIKKGELAVICGESGKGKTTLLNAIGMLEKNYTGTISINGLENCKFDSKKGRNLLRNNIGFLFQNYGLMDNKTVFQNLELGLYFKKITKKEKIKMMKEVLKPIGLIDKLNTKVYKLSGGEQQRIALARLILKQCDIILADEPTGSLDAKNKDIVMQSLSNLKTSGKTVIVVTHDTELMEMADKCIRI
ncbi:MAG: putative bacteriocin export ABC transporter [Mycoplasmatales bacterium]